MLELLGVFGSVIMWVLSCFFVCFIVYVVIISVASIDRVIDNFILSMINNS